MGDFIDTINIQAEIQENGIIRNAITGMIIGRLINSDCEFNALKVYDKQVNNGDFSDGYHTFNELYHHRAVLFSIICNLNRHVSWKSKLHHDGTMFDNMFIVGITTPEGQYSYHYDIDPYWNMFNVTELDNAPEWDGHKPGDIGRLNSLLKYNKAMVQELKEPSRQQEVFEIAMKINERYNLTVKVEDMKEEKNNA